MVCIVDRDTHGTDCSSGAFDSLRGKIINQSNPGKRECHRRRNMKRGLILRLGRGKHLRGSHRHPRVLAIVNLMCRRTSAHRDCHVMRQETYKHLCRQVREKVDKILGEDTHIYVRPLLKIEQSFRSCRTPRMIVPYPQPWYARTHLRTAAYSVRQRLT